jgi:hypothetical protein
LCTGGKDRERGGRGMQVKEEERTERRGEERKEKKRK